MPKFTSRYSFKRKAIPKKKFKRAKRSMKRHLGGRTTGLHVFSRRLLAVTEEINGFLLARMYSFRFNQIIEHGEFGALFEKYRITKIIMKFQLINNPNAIAAENPGGNTFNRANWYPKMWYAVDDDGGSTDIISTIKERQNVRCRILEPNKTVTVSFTPKVRVLAYKTDTTQGYAPKAMAIDMADVEVPHYGLSVVFDTNGVNPDDTYPFKVIIETQYKFACSGVR